MFLILLQTKGELSAEKKEKYEEAFNNYQKLLSNSTTFAVSSIKGGLVHLHCKQLWGFHFCLSSQWGSNLSPHKINSSLTLLHSEWPILVVLSARGLEYRVFDILSAVGLRV